VWGCLLRKTPSSNRLPEPGMGLLFRRGSKAARGKGSADSPRRKRFCGDLDASRVLAQKWENTAALQREVQTVTLENIRGRRHPRAGWVGGRTHSRSGRNRRPSLPKWAELQASRTQRLSVCDEHHDHHPDPVDDSGTIGSRDTGMRWISTRAIAWISFRFGSRTTISRPGLILRSEARRDIRKSRR
jgi:hypothetical protein